ncbi:TcfC E-set like domain-containing protein [Vibrio splendidus]|uniref:CFA/I fimbrial subunit C (Colonizationfactor antigen I subunit C) n=2 Tax=Vibrio splendidus TaxID=29497 RepID=A0A0H3ZV57_VIBSP|nr:hypothetical protein [Vibrio splendidus]AKN39756.1 CFA/I fimbrial subunit C precursor (Colonizationfactor antigen I subunit C) [Vibrio splendidus]
MNTVLKPLLCLPLFVTTVCASTNYYPEEFQDFFVETPQKIYVVVAGDKGGEDVNALVNYDTFRLRDHPTDIQVFSQFLEGKGLNDRAIKRIVSDMQRGVSSDESCGGRLSSCVPDTSDGQTKFVFDFDSSSLKIFIAPHALRDDLDEVMYESAINRQQAIVNWANLYAYTDLSQQEQVTLSNQTTLGLPMGHLYFDTEYTSSDNEFDVYTALYDVEYEDLRLQAGRNRYNPTFNSTDYLNNGASFMGDYIQLGSSTNLLKGKESAQQRIYFYAPQNGQLELYRDDRLILNKVVSEGKQYISYADLPKGAYTATLLLKVAGKTVLTETRQIVNNNQFSLKKGSMDYVLGAGFFDQNDDSQSDAYNYVRGLANYRLTEQLQVGAGVTSNSDSQYYQISSAYMPNNHASLEYVGGRYSEGDVFHTARLSYDPFFVDYRQLVLTRDSDQEHRLVNLMYGESNYRDIGVGISGNLWGSTGYLRYSHNTSSSVDGLSSYGSQTVSGGVFYTLPTGQISLSVDYTNPVDYDDELRTTLSYTLDIGDGLSTQFSVYGDEHGLDKNTNYLRMNRNHGNWFSNASLGASVDRDAQTMSDLSGSLSGHNQHINATAYGYMNDSGTQSLSGGLSGTQIFSLEGVDTTYEKSRAFAKVSKHFNGAGDNPGVRLVVTKDGKYQQNREILQETSVIKLDDFASQELTLDQGSNNVDIEGNRLNVFTLPGSYYHLEAQVIELLSRVVILDDVNDKPIDSLQCIGDGCVSVEPLSDDGVYRVNYKKDIPYRLVSHKGLCIYDPQAISHYTNGYCLPGIESEAMKRWPDSSKLLEQVEREELLVYLGRFKAGTESDGIKRRLDTHSIRYKAIEVAGEAFFYVMDKQEFMPAQIDLLEKLDAYVLLRNAEVDLLTIHTELGNKNEV